MTTIGERIAYLRQKRNLNKKDVCEATGIKPSNMTLYEQGKTKPASDAIVALAEYFHISTDWILTGKGPGPDEEVNQEMAEKIRWVEEEIKGNTHLQKMLYPFLSTPADLKMLSLLQNFLEKNKELVARNRIEFDSDAIKFLNNPRFVTFFNHFLNLSSETQQLLVYMTEDYIDKVDSDQTLRTWLDFLLLLTPNERMNLYALFRKTLDDLSSKNVETETKEPEVYTDPDLARMINVLTALMTQDDMDIRGWTKVQFKKAFGELVEQIQEDAATKSSKDSA